MAGQLCEKRIETVCSDGRKGRGLDELFVRGEIRYQLTGD
jgi:hypothetical protein